MVARQKGGMDCARYKKRIRQGGGLLMTADQVTTENLNFYRNRAAAQDRRVITVKTKEAMDEAGR